MSFTLALEVCTRADGLGACIRARQAALGLGWPPRAAHQLGLVVAELVGNAVRHGRGGRLRLELEPREWTLEVSDSGPGFTSDVLQAGALGLLPTWRPAFAPGPQRGLGSGLACAARLSHTLELFNLPQGGACVRARGSLVSPAIAAPMELR